jgi:hypothetical protein
MPIPPPPGIAGQVPPPQPADGAQLIGGANHLPGRAARRLLLKHPPKMLDQPFNVQRLGQVRVKPRPLAAVGGGWHRIRCYGDDWN